METTSEKKKAMEESDVGIFCYISDLPGFRGILKQRYADFIVNEVDTDGNVVHLTCLDAPPQNAEEVETKDCDQMNRSYTSEIESFKVLAGDADAEKLEAFISQVTSGTEGCTSPIVLSPDPDKAHRTALHNFFKENFKFLITDTVDGPDASSKCIRVRLNSGGHNSGRNSKKRKERGDRPFDSRNSSYWPEQLGKFLRFHLYKENKDTQEALGLLAKMLGIQSRSFGFTGTKDKRAVTTQRVTVFKQQASRLAALNDRLIGIKVGDFCHVKEALVLGQLLGNQFTITLRGVVADSDDTIKASADSLGRNGFINYYGLQRFGSSSVPTHLIGAALLRGEWKSAVSMILDPREGERDTIKSAREYYKESGDIEGTISQLPRHMVAERATLQCLKKSPGNYLQALKAIPRTLRMMYVHSYQSYLWNHAASARVQKYGTDQVVLGDLVRCSGAEAEKETVGSFAECGDDILDVSHLDETSGPDLPEIKNIRVKVVTAEDLCSGRYTIDDVTLPMPGCRTLYPTNEVAQVYHDLADKDGINLTKSVHNVKEFSITSMTGNYRLAFQKPLDFKWEILTYTDSSAPLAETDMDKLMNGKCTIAVDNQVNGTEELVASDCTKHPESIQIDMSTSVDANEASDDKEGFAQVLTCCSSNLPEAQTALKLSFILPASCYATMAIRELLKTSTAVSFHKTLNQ